MKYLIPIYTGLGNAVLKTPLISSIQNHDNDYQIILLGDNQFGAVDILADRDRLIDVYDIPRSIGKIDQYKLISWINREKFDCIMMPFDSSPKWLMKIFLLSNCKKIVLHVRIKDLSINNLIYLQNKRVIPVPLLPGRHEVDLNLDLLEHYLSCFLERSYKQWLSIKPNRVLLEKFYLNKPFICFQVGAANGANSPKIWHPDNFKRLSKIILSEYPHYSIVLIGDRGDSEIDNVNFGWPEKVKDLIGKTSLQEVVSLIDNSKTVIAHDSGIMHLANALNTPLIALYGPTDFTRTMPLGEKSKVLFSKTEAFAAMYNWKATEQEIVRKYPNYESMSGISVDTVFQEVNKHLKH